jgi:hypothetical protein
MKLTDVLLTEIKKHISKKTFKKITLKDAIEYVQSGGLIPNAKVDIDTWFKFDDFIQRWQSEKSDATAITFTATELKNKTGQILTCVLQGKKVNIQRHKRTIAVILPPK